MRAIDLTGQKFGRLTAVVLAKVSAKKRLWACVCECGAFTQVRTDDLRSGRQQSCGCHKSAVTAQRNRDNAKHGMTHTGVYRSWIAMNERCRNPNSISWKWYGAKGVTVCPQWLDFDTFFKDMGHRSDALSIDRIDPYGNYEPGNCRWATPQEQAANRRMS